MSTHNICFCREIRKMWICFCGKKCLIKSYGIPLPIWSYVKWSYFLVSSIVFPPLLINILELENGLVKKGPAKEPMNEGYGKHTEVTRRQIHCLSSEEVCTMYLNIVHKVNKYFFSVLQVIGPDKRGYQENSFLISPRNHILGYSLEMPQ